MVQIVRIEFGLGETILEVECLPTMMETLAIVDLAKDRNAWLPSHLVDVCHTSDRLETHRPLVKLCMPRVNNCDQDFQTDVSGIKRHQSRELAKNLI